MNWIEVSANTIARCSKRGLLITCQPQEEIQRLAEKSRRPIYLHRGVSTAICRFRETDHPYRCKEMGASGVFKNPGMSWEREAKEPALREKEASEQREKTWIAKLTQTGIAPEDR